MKRIDGCVFGLGKLLLILLTSGCLCPYAMGQAQAQGQWATLPYTMPINPIHVSLLHNGKPGKGHARHIFHATINSGWEPLPAGSRSDPAHLAGLPPGVDCLGVGRLRSKHQLRGCRLGPTGGNHHHPARWLGHVLQRDGSYARRTAVRSGRHSAVRSLLRIAEYRCL